MLSTIPSDMETMSDFLWNKSLACISVFIFNCADFLSQISVCNHQEPLVPKIGKNHWKTIVANGWSHQKPSMVMVRNFQNHRHSIVGEKKPSPFHRLEELTIVPVYFTIYTAVKTDDGAPFNAVPSFWTAFLHFLWKKVVWLSTSTAGPYLITWNLPKNTITFFQHLPCLIPQSHTVYLSAASEESLPLQ